MEGSKAIRYWDKETRTIKVSRNFTFSKNGELQELQITEIPGLGAEEESATTAPQTTPENVKLTTDNLMTPNKENRLLRNPSHQENQK